MGSQKREVTVPTSMDGMRIDVALARLSGYSRSQAQRLIESGRAGGFRDRVLRPNARAKKGELIWYFPEREAPVRPMKLALDVRYEDPHLAIVNKPPGMVVHPGPGHGEGTLVSALVYRWPEIEGVGEYPRWGIVHRLDKETSGVMVIARRETAYRGLVSAIAGRKVGRNYLALVHGLFQVGAGTIEAPIVRRRARQSVGPGGKPAVTHYRRMASWSRPPVSLMDIALETGRTHQIRVHMESIERYLVGDRVYGKPGPQEIDPGRVWLHAYRLQLSHPVSGVDLDVSAPLPDDLASSLAALGKPDLGTANVATVEEPTNNHT